MVFQLVSADQLFYGPLETCAICDAGLVFAGHDFKCSGFISEWSKCNYSTHEAQRLKGSLKIPKKVKNDFLKEVGTCLLKSPDYVVKQRTSCLMQCMRNTMSLPLD